MAITRAIPDVRTTDIVKTARFYTELLGFDLRMEGGDVAAFVSATNPGVEVTVNRDGFALPPGFTVEVDSVDAVRTLYERGRHADVRIIEELTDDGRQFSVLDPSGRRITVAACGDIGAQSSSGDPSRSITRAIPGATTNDTEASRRFYIDYLGFDLAKENDGVLFFRAPTATGAQLIASTATATHDGFDLVVGSLDRLDDIHRAAQGRWFVLHPPTDFPEHGIRCFMLLDPNGIGVAVAALLSAESRIPSHAAPLR